MRFVGDTEEAETQPFQVNTRYLRMTLLHNEAMLNELVFKDSSGEYIVPANASQYPELFDEQDEFDPELGFRSGTYFDEVYHARTAYFTTLNFWASAPFAEYVCTLTPSSFAPYWISNI